MRVLLILTTMIVGASSLLPRDGSGYNWNYALIKSHYPLTERTRSCVLCHTRGGPNNLNPYGSKFLAAGAGAAALAALEKRDTDGDGASNEVELKTGHFPGDAADVPTPAEVAALRTGRPVPRDLEREILETLQCPCCDKLVMNCQCEMVPEIRRIVRDHVAAGGTACEIREALVARFGRKILPLAERRETLPASSFTNRRVANAYRIAAELPGELEKYPCFCTCYRANGHLSLLDCFKNGHAARCQICIEEAESVETMVGGGSPEGHIREHLVARFRTRG